MKFLAYCSIGLFLTAATAVAASTPQYAPDAREQLPSAMVNSYFGMGAGYTDFPFTKDNLLNGLQPTSIVSPTFGLNVFIGHYFNPYIAGEISLMRPLQWVGVNGVTPPNTAHTIWISVFGISAKPTLPISARTSLYGLAGLGIISRHGFFIGNNMAIPSQDIATFLTGGGMTYAITPHWHLNLGVQYTVPRTEEHQPSTFYAFGGFSYLFKKLDLPTYYNTHYIFHKNLVLVGAFSKDVFDPDVNKYFSVKYLPIFWTGDLKTNSGGWVMYERNVFHTHKMFSLNLGASASIYESYINHTTFEAFSVYPVIRVWLIRSPSIDFYFKYAIAGPTYLTRYEADNVHLGGNFSFQDLLGIGFFLGQSKHFNMDFTIGHYSNGNLLPNNPGVQVPMMVSLGYAFD